MGESERVPSTNEERRTQASKHEGRRHEEHHRQGQEGPCCEGPGQESRQGSGREEGQVGRTRRRLWTRQRPDGHPPRTRNGRRPSREPPVCRAPTPRSSPPPTTCLAVSRPTTTPPPRGTTSPSLFWTSSPCTSPRTSWSCLRSRSP